MARKVALRLRERGNRVVGIDVRPWLDAPREIEVHRLDLRKRAAADVWRRLRPDAVIHMATVTALSVLGEERHRFNLDGTRAVIERSAASKVRLVLFVGRHTWYGAAPAAPLYHTEDEPPQGLVEFPELADLVAADLYAATALWRYPEMTTAVLRVCYTLGPSGHGTLARFLRGRRVPVVAGFDPLIQMMHEDDAADAIVLAFERRLKAIFNVAGPQPLPMSVIVRECGRKRLPIPEPLLALALGRGGLPRLPRGALEHLKYPVVVDATAFRQATGFAHRFDEAEVIASFREGFPAL
jgi:UDP-glucose 4-epimerase